jgi:hypothetical protein
MDQIPKDYYDHIQIIQYINDSRLRISGGITMRLITLHNIELTPEEQLIIELSRTALNKDVFRDFNVNDFNWIYFYELIRDHSVSSIVYKNIKAINFNINEINNDILRKLKIESVYSFYVKSKYKTLLNDIVKFQNKIVVIKGKALDDTIYYGCRDYNDIDILIDSSDSFINIHKILLGLGFICDKRDENVEQLFKQNCTRICSYTYRDKICFLSIDIHKVIQNSSECLDKLYENAICVNNSMHYPTLWDSCIFACYHAWHHYPHTYTMILNIPKLKLKNLMDIRETYLQIKKNSEEYQFYEYVDSIGALNVIREMLYLTERVYDEFISHEFRFNFICRVKHDYKDNEFESKFERRLFYSPIEKEIALSILDKNLSLLKNGRKMLCTYSESLSINEESYNKNRILTLKNGVWNDVYGSFISSTNDQSAIFYLCWNSYNLCIYTEVFNNKSILGNNRFFDEEQDSIVLRLDSKLIEYSIQLKSDMQVISYLEDKDQEIWIENNKIKSYLVNKTKDYYKIQSIIPWDQLDLLPKENMTFDFIMNVLVGNARDFNKQRLMPFGSSIKIKLLPIYTH